MRCSSNSKSVNFVGNYQGNQNNPYLNIYNPGWRNCPNFLWGNLGCSSNPEPSNPLLVFQPKNRTFPQLEKKPTIEEMMFQLLTSQIATLKNLEN